MLRNEASATDETDASFLSMTEAKKDCSPPQKCWGGLQYRKALNMLFKKNKCESNLDT